MIVGTAGHIDHGKTSLVRALTGVDTDRLKEEKARGITIALGFAYLPSPQGRVIGFIDVPGHERFVHTMLAGATGIDFALLVVAADDGIMPQTREHLAILELLGIDRGIVALAKADLADAAQREAVTGALHRELARTPLAEAEIITVSTYTGEGVEALRQALFDAANGLPARRSTGRFRLAVDRSFELAGAGTVVTGTVLSGQVAVGDHVRVSPSGIEARVRSLHAQNRAAERGVAGQRCALNLAGPSVSKEAIRRGDIVLDAGLHAPSDRIDAELRLLAAESKAVGAWFPARLHHAATEVGARIVPLGDDIQPGAAERVQLVLERPIAAAAGDRFVLRDTTGQRTIGGGRFLDLRAPPRRRRTPDRLRQLDAHALADPAEAVGALLEVPPQVLDLGSFARDRTLDEDELAALVERAGLIAIPADRTVWGLSAAGWMRFRQILRTDLAAFHEASPDLQGIGQEKLRLQLQPRLPAPLFAAALRVLARAGEVALDGAWARLPEHQSHLSPEREALWQRIAPLLGGEVRFRPPRVRDVAGELGHPEEAIRRLLKLAGRMGRVDEVAHDHFFLRGTVAEMAAIVADLGTAGEFTAAQFRDRVDNGRKVAIQILEFFDRHGLTLRRGDLRRANKHRLDLFAATGTANTQQDTGGATLPVGRPDFKSGKGRETVFGGFDSHSPPPPSEGR